MKYGYRDVVAAYAKRGEGGPLKAACSVIVDILDMLAQHRTSIDRGDERVADLESIIADLRETLGGVENQVQMLSLRVGVEEQRTSRSITDWASAGYPLLLERAEKAEAELQKTLSMLDKANVTIGRLVLGGEAVEQALTDVRAVVGKPPEGNP